MTKLLKRRFMVEEKRETVVVEGDRDRSSVGWIIGVVVIIILLALFFMSGGFGLFGGSTTNTNSTNVQPTTGQ
jgi:hypothetical protein